MSACWKGGVSLILVARRPKGHLKTQRKEGEGEGEVTRITRSERQTRRERVHLCIQKCYTGGDFMRRVSLLGVTGHA